MSGPWDQFRTGGGISGRELAPPVAEGPWTRYRANPATGITLDFDDGREVFPSDTPRETIRAEIDRRAKTPEQRKRLLDQWADQFVSRERQGGGLIQFAQDRIRNLAQGTPVGSWLDEANATTEGVLNTVTGGRLGSPRDEALAYQRATDRAIERDGGLVGTATQVVGGVASIPVAPVVTAVRGAAALPRIINAAVTGGLYGTLYGAGEGETWDEGALNAVKGLGLGAGIGAASVPVAQGIGNAIGYAVDRFKGLPQALQGTSRGAVDRVTRAMTDDGMMVPGAAADRLRGLGPEGMIADLGDNTRAQAGAVASLPGEGKSIVMQAMRDRTAGSADRIRTDVDRALGPPQDVTRLVNQDIPEASRRIADPLYSEFRSTPIPFTPQVEQTLAALQSTRAGRTALAAAAENVNVDRAIGRYTGSPQFFASIADDGSVIINRVPNAAEWDYVKRALDESAKSAQVSDRNAAAQFSGLADRVRSSIDEALSPGAPNQSIYARARAASGEGARLANAVEEGRTAFDRNLSPDQMRFDMGRMQPGERVAYRTGARDQVRQIMGNASTQWGENAASAARARLGADNAREKLRMLTDETGADRLLNRLDTETQFARTNEAVRGNSMTAARSAAQREFPASDPQSARQNVNQTSATGLVMRALYETVNAATRGALDERQAMIAADAARLLVAQGVPRDQIVRALLDHADSQAMTAQGREAVERLVRGLIRGTSTTTVDAFAP